ncbi:MAG: hypothetical protein PVF49_09485, partial [Anaerolineales bacterium]
LSTSSTALAHDPEAALDQAVEWLAGQQLEDGGFSTGFSDGSDLGASVDAAIAFASAGQDPASVSTQGVSLMDYLLAAVAETDLQDSPGLAAKVALAVIASGRSPDQFGEVDLIALINSGYNQAVGLYGTGPFDSALAVLALSAAGQDLPAGAVDGLLTTRIEDGSYGFTGDTTPGSGDSNTTALVVQALVAAGAAPQEIQPSLDYFMAVQNDDGGWTYQKPSDFGEATDANSTALVMQALLASGESLEEWGDPVDALLLFQDSSGAFGFNAAMPDPSLLATVQAIPALAGVDYTEIGTLDLAAGSTQADSNLLLLTLAIIVGLIAVAALINWQQPSQEE